jgi:hypothetical protein
VALSLDDGATWARVASVEEEVGASLRFHYPTLHQYGCQLFVAYSTFCTFTPAGSPPPSRWPGMVRAE